jgi:electron transport complex protein RnfE
MGVGFTLALVLMASIREILGAGSFAGIAIPFMQNHTVDIFVKAPGGMMVYGILMAVVIALTKGKAPKKKSFECEGCPCEAVCNGAHAECSHGKEEAK